MNGEREIMRMEIEGRWSAYEMSQTFAALHDLYNLRLFIEVNRRERADWEEFYHHLMNSGSFSYKFRKYLLHPAFIGWPSQAFPSIPLDTAELSRYIRIMGAGEQLSIVRIEYGSPGFSDLGGAGEIVGHVKDFVLGLLDRYLDRKNRKLRDDGLRIENARNFVQLARDLGYNDEEIRKLIRFVDDRQEILIEMIEAEKIRKVFLLSEENDLKR